MEDTSTAKQKLVSIMHQRLYADPHRSLDNVYSTILTKVHTAKADFKI